MHTFARHLVLASILLATGAVKAQEATPTVTIPAFCGYAYPDAAAMQRDHKTGVVKQCPGELYYYFECLTAGQLRVAIERLPDSKEATLDVRIGAHPGSKYTDTTMTLLKGEQLSSVGTFELLAPGMHRLIIKSVDGDQLRNLKALQLSGCAVQACLVERRNASSVHLGFSAPAAHKDDIEWFYCEATPKTDPLWTYYMATGWHRGYFGMQVNSETERRVIFSVWDSGNEAVDRSKVKAEDLVQLVRKGDQVHADGFGNEGTGGHSHLVHDWKLGDTIRFLVRAEVVDAHTIYTGWFSHVHGHAKSPVTDVWQLVASFNAPGDGKHLHGLYSFSENFSGSNGDRDRQCDYGNIWLRTKGGEWLAVRAAKFTHDGHGKLRSDRRGGVRDGRFFLQHGDFATPSMSYGSEVSLAGEAGSPPTGLPQ